MITFKYKERYIPQEQVKFNNHIIDYLASIGIDYNNLSQDMKHKCLGKFVNKCNMCPNRSQRKYVEFNPNAKVLIISRAFLKKEHNYIKYLTYELAYNLGYSKSDVYLTSSSFCSFDKLYEYQDYNFKKCYLYKDLEISLFSPEVILLLGNDAYTNFFNTNQTVMSILGEVFYTNFNDRRVPIIVIPHPAYLMRDEVLKTKVNEFCANLRPIIKGWDYAIPRV